MRICTVLIYVLFGCGGSLSDDQRKQMRDKMEDNKIVRVTEVEITEAAFAEGRAITKTLERLTDDSTRLDSFLKINQGRIRYIQPGTRNTRALEQQLLDAYLADPSGSFEDNVQKLRNNEGGFDSLLYTMPVTGKLPDGSKKLDGVWNIWLPKKELVMEIGRNQ